MTPPSPSYVSLLLGILVNLRIYMNINEDNPRNKICEEYKDSLIKVNDYAFIDIWNKVFKIKNLSFFF